MDIIWLNNGEVHECQKKIMLADPNMKILTQPFCWEEHWHVAPVSIN